MYPRLLNGSAAGILGEYFFKVKNFNMLPYRHRPMSSHEAIRREQALSSAIFIFPENGTRSKKPPRRFLAGILPVLHALPLSSPREIRNPPVSSETTCPEASPAPLSPPFSFPRHPGTKIDTFYFFLPGIPDIHKNSLAFHTKKHIENIVFYIYIY